MTSKPFSVAYLRAIGLALMVPGAGTHPDSAAGAVPCVSMVGHGTFKIVKIGSGLRFG